MTPYLLVETRSVWESGEVAGHLALAVELATAGHPVDFFLVQNAVLMAGPDNAALAALAASPAITLWADGVSLAARTIPAASVPDHITVTGFETIVGLMTRAGSKTIWH